MNDMALDYLKIMTDGYSRVVLFYGSVTDAETKSYVDRTMVKMETMIAAASVYYVNVVVGQDEVALENLANLSQKFLVT